MTNARASDIQALLEFDVYDEDVSDYELIGACIYPVSDATFSGSSVAVECPSNPGAGGSGYSLDFRLVPF